MFTLKCKKCPQLSQNATPPRFCAFGEGLVPIIIIAIIIMMNLVAGIIVIIALLVCRLFSFGLRPLKKKILQLVGRTFWPLIESIIIISVLSHLAN